MRRKLLANGLVSALVVMVVLGAATPARASQLFAFNYSLPPGAGPTPMAVSASGLFATTDLVGSSYTIIGAWGTWNGTAITGVFAPGTVDGNDNLLFSSNPFLDLNGVSFAVNGPGDNGSGNVNVYYDASQGGYTENSTNVGGGPNFSIATPSPVYFNFSYSIPGTGLTSMDVSASGILTAFGIDANSYLVSDISGSWNGVNILSLLSPGTFGNDNLLFGAAPHLTAYGLGYAVNGVGDDGSGNVNVYYDASQGGYTENSTNVGGGPNFNISQTETETPEPASVTLLCASIPFVLFLVRRRSRAQRLPEQK